MKLTETNKMNRKTIEYIQKQKKTHTYENVNNYYAEKTHNKRIQHVDIFLFIYFIGNFNISLSIYSVHNLRLWKKFGNHICPPIDMLFVTGT